MSDGFDLRVFIFSILFKWRTMLIYILIIGLLGGGIAVVSSLAGGYDAATVKEYEVALAKYTVNKRAIEDQITTYNKKIEEINNYMKNSILMNLNPLEVRRASLAYYIDNGYKIIPGSSYQDVNPIESIKNSYAEFLNKNLDQILKEAEFFSMNVAEVLLYELITIDLSNENIVKIYISNPNDFDLEKLVAVMDKYLSVEREQLSTVIVPHSIELIASSNMQTYSSSIEHLQNNKSEELTKHITNANTRNTELLAMKIPESPLTNTRSLLVRGVKYVVLFGIIGAILGVVIGFLRDALSSKLSYSTDIPLNISDADILRLPTFYLYDEKTNFIDTKLHELYGDAINKNNLKEVIFNVMNRENIPINNAILIISSLFGDETDKIMTDFKNIKLEEVNLSYSAKDSSSGRKNIILLEKLSISKISAVEKTFAQHNAYGNVLCLIFM